MYDLPKVDAEGFPVCTPGLRKLLTEGDSAFGAARIISINATLLNEAREVSGAFDEAIQPLTIGPLLALLSRHAPDLGVEVPEEDHAIFWNAYFRELQTFPIESVEQAFMAWKRGEWDPKNPIWKTIFPKPAQLVRFAAAHQAKLGQMRAPRIGS